MAIEYSSRASSNKNTLWKIRIENHFVDSVRVIHFGWLEQETHSIQLAYDPWATKRKSFTELIFLVLDINVYVFVYNIWNWKQWKDHKQTFRNIKKKKNNKNNAEHFFKIYFNLTNEENVCVFVYVSVWLYYFQKI